LTLGGPWADGAIVSNTDDVARFFSVLLGGKLLRPKELRAMKTVAFTAGHNGLGIFRGRTGCRASWGHDGGTPGYLTTVYASGDGRHVVMMATNGVSNPTGRALDRAANESFCAT